MLAIINAELVMRNHTIPEAVLFIEDGVIRGFGEMRNTPIPENCEILDVQGAYVGPGFVDIHTHSDGRVFFYEDPVRCSQHHLQNGTTSLMPALYTSMNTQQYVEAVQIIRQAMEKPECGNIAGLYMEGPYLNPGFGCDRSTNPWADGVKKEAYQPVIDAAWDLARVWCVAPERENILDFVLDVKAKNPDAAFAVAHSAAAPAQIEALIPYGLRIGTHHTNATGDLPKYPECRGVCVDETVNYNRDIYAELICDSRGIHVDPYMLRLVRKIKGDDRIILISDTYVCDGPIPEGYDGVTDINFDHAGEIAGSNLTLDVACRNFMVHTGCSVCDAFRFAAYNPAKLLGLRDLGEIKVGNRANLVMVDGWFGVQKVILNGEMV